jgi:hypothetical protein
MTEKMTDGEEYLYQRIMYLRESYAKEIKPYVDRLIEIQRLSIRPIFITEEMIKLMNIKLEIKHD